MFPALAEEAGVCAPAEAASDCASAGVDAPLLFCVDIMDASLRDASEMICLTFLLRRWGGFHDGLRKGLGMPKMSSLSSRAWWLSSLDAWVIGAMVEI